MTKIILVSLVFTNKLPWNPVEKPSGLSTAHHTLPCGTISSEVDFLSSREHLYSGFDQYKGYDKQLLKFQFRW